jgi:predicted transcriptional regulator
MRSYPAVAVAAAVAAVERAVGDGVTCITCTSTLVKL